MDIKKTEKAIFNYKTLRLVMMGFGSLMISIGSMYAYFIISTLGFDGLDGAMMPLITSILSVPAGIFVCIVGKKLKGPIIKDE